LVRFTVPPGRAQPDSRWHTSFTVCAVREHPGSDTTNLYEVKLPFDSRQ
jgi:hypothetical protein